jgi:hypothetical protein
VAAADPLGRACWRSFPGPQEEVIPHASIRRDAENLESGRTRGQRRCRCAGLFGNRLTLRYEPAGVTPLPG